VFLGCSNKKYFNHFDPSPEFCIAFLPCEAFYSVAIREDPGIIEYCLDKKVVLASPVTLIALLKVIEFGWRQGDLAENHEEVRRFHRFCTCNVLCYCSHQSFALYR
jgi:DNA recombination protein RmuC